jgi:hypothetical protein
MGVKIEKGQYSDRVQYQLVIKMIWLSQALECGWCMKPTCY